MACVCDHDNGHARKLYVDGVLVASDSPTSWYVGGGHLWMGRKRPDTARWDFKGYIDEARMYTRALTEAEIKGLAARSDAANTCFTQPVNPCGITDGTIYASTDAHGRAGGHRHPGRGRRARCASPAPARGVTGFLRCSVVLRLIRMDYQTALVPTLTTGKSLTLEGGWDSTFTTHDAATSPTTLDAGDDGSGGVWRPGHGFA